VSRIAGQLIPLLKPAYFRKIGNLFWRISEEGVVQYVQIQTERAPPTSSELHFWINLAVSVDEVSSALGYSDRPGPKSPWLASIRLGNLIRPDSDVAWSFYDPAIIADVRDALVSHGLPWLEGLKTRRQIVATWDDEPQRLPIPAHGEVLIAVVRWHLGDTAQAERDIRSYVASLREPMKSFVMDLVNRSHIILS
jgi:hypothetical protein